MGSALDEWRDDYLRAMAGCPQFAHFGIRPQWRPGDRDIRGFIHDEVVRQWHDPRVKWDGGDRIRGMCDAWQAAGAVHLHRTPTPYDIIALAQRIEPLMNRDGFRTVSVEIGGRVAPPWSLVPALVRQLCRYPGTEAGTADLGPDAYTVDNFGEQASRIRRADDWYLAFEWIHPFCDGNGRTGKILHNWLLGTLADPVLVPDYFKAGVP